MNFVLPLPSASQFLHGVIGTENNKKIYKIYVSKFPLNVYFKESLNNIKDDNMIVW